jgi:hypothetical protein
MIPPKKTATTPNKSCMKRMTDTPPPRDLNTKRKGSESRLRFLDPVDSEEDDIDD